MPMFHRIEEILGDPEPEIPDSYRILLVDEDPAYRRATRQALKDAGIEAAVYEAASCAEAEQSLCSVTLDCAFVDFRLPDGEGVRVIHAARRLAHPVPVVILTGQGDVQLAVDVMKAGAADYLNKERVTPEELARALHTSVRLYRAESTAHRAEDALRAGQHQLVTTLRSIGDAVIACDSNCRVTFMNPVAEELTGWSHSDAVGRLLNEVFDIRDESTGRRCANPAETVLCDGLTVGLSGRTLLRSRDGAERPIDDSGAPIRDLQGNVSGVVLVFRDVTEPRRQIQALEESEERFRVMADSAPMLLWVSGPDSGCTFFNQRWLDFTGRTLEEEMGPGWAESLHPAERERILAEYMQAFEARQMFEQEFRLRRRDGVYRWVLSRGLPRYEPGGAFAGYIGTCIDITERKEAEEEILKSRADIEALNERLRIAMRETHHRVKNNLQIIAAMVDMRANEGSRTVSQAELKQLGAYVQTLAVVHDILTHEPHGDESRFVSAAAVLGKLVPMIRETAGNRPISLDVDDAALSAKQGTSLAIVVNELLSNAIKYGRHATSVRFHAEGDVAELQVADDGPGFPPGFDARKSGSTGIELVESLSRTDLGGCVRYDNVPEGGACVTISVRLSE